MDQWKVVLLGDHGVGKTALATQFTTNHFPTHYDPMEEEYRKLFLVDDRKCLLDIPLAPVAGVPGEILRDPGLRECHGFMLVYSIGSRATFERLEFYRQLVIQAKASEEDPVIVIIGNKCDQGHGREVSTEEGAAFARNIGCEFSEASAKTAHNVDEVFFNLIRTLRRAESVADATSPISKGSPRKKYRRCIIL